MAAKLFQIRTPGGSGGMSTFSNNAFPALVRTGETTGGKMAVGGSVKRSAVDIKTCPGFYTNIFLSGMRQTAPFPESIILLPT